MVSYILRPGFEIKYPGFVWNFLKNTFKSELSEKVKFVKLVKGRQAAAFDVPEEFTNEIEFRMAEINSNFILEKANSVVEFEE